MIEPDRRPDDSLPGVECAVVDAQRGESRRCGHLWRGDSREGEVTASWPDCEGLVGWGARRHPRGQSCIESNLLPAADGFVHLRDGELEA